jgi:sugar phosphate isomerase/epimerase
VQNTGPEGLTAVAVWAVASPARRSTLQVGCSQNDSAHTNTSIPASENGAVRVSKRTARSSQKDMNRREFMKLSGTAIMAAGPILYAAARPPVWGLQLYTVISLLERDFERTLRDVAAIGYTQVETIGSFGRDPAYVRDLFAKYGLVSASQHIAPPDVYRVFAAWTQRRITTTENEDYFVKAFGLDRAESVIENGISTAKALGQKYVTWQILFEPFLRSRQVIDRVIRVFNAAGEACAKEGLVFAFHNQDREFMEVDGNLPYDLIVANTDRDKVKMEMDFHRMSKAGADPIRYLEKYAGRYRMCHVKDMDKTGDYAIVGAGVLDIPGLVKAASASGVEHFYVELDRPLNPMGEIEQSYAYLKKHFPE